jgi:selenocysteine-specific elongation factor
VLDAHPLVRLTRPKTQDWLEQVRNAALEQQLTLRIARRGTTGMTIATVSAETGVNADAIRAVLAPMLREAGLILLENDLLLTLEAVNEANLMATQRFQGLSEGVGLDGVKKSELRSKTRLRPEVFDYVLIMLEHEKKLRVVNELLFPATGGTDPSSHDRERLSAISRVFEQSGLAAPSPASLAEEFRIDPAEMRRLITILLRERKLVRLGDDSLCVDQGAVTTLKQTIQELRGQTIDVARFKQITGVSRKFAIPLLEYLDRERITRKQGDHRIVL